MTGVVYSITDVERTVKPPFGKTDVSQTKYDPRVSLSCSEVQINPPLGSFVVISSRLHSVPSFPSVIYLGLGQSLEVL